jgi:hypothetical protein
MMVSRRDTPCLSRVMSCMGSTQEVSLRGGVRVNE